MRFLAALVAAALVAVVPAAVATPFGLETRILATTVAVSGTSFSIGGDYVVERAVVDKDGTLVFTNADLLSQHDVVATASGPATNPWCARYPARPCPLFASPLIGGDPLAGPESALVEGIDQLAPLTNYAFECTLHSWMKGTITTI